MKKFNYFTESYETIRQTLRELFVYGCYDSSISAERQKISGRKYSDELKRIRYFWSKQISAKRYGEKKMNFFYLIVTLTAKIISCAHIKFTHLSRKTSTFTFTYTRV